MMRNSRDPVNWDEDGWKVHQKICFMLMRLEEGSFEKIRELLKEKIDPFWSDAGTNALHAAATSNENAWIIRSLLKQNVSQQMENSNGETPAMVAIRWGVVDALEALWSDSRKQTQTKGGGDLMDIAIDYGRADVIDFLFAKGMSWASGNRARGAGLRAICDHEQNGWDTKERCLRVILNHAQSLPELGENFARFIGNSFAKCARESLDPPEKGWVEQVLKKAENSKLKNMDWAELLRGAIESESRSADIKIWNHIQQRATNSEIIWVFGMVEGLMQSRDLSKKSKVKLDAMRQKCFVISESFELTQEIQSQKKAKPNFL